MKNNQLLILEKIEPIVKSITPSNGYFSDLSEIPVIYWQDTNFEYKEKTICIQDFVEQITTKNQSLENLLLVKVSVIQPIEQVNLLLTSTQLVTDFKKAFSYPSFGQNLAGIFYNANLRSVEKKVETKGTKMLKICADLAIKYKEEI